jgi:hypothetical protein
MGELKESGMSIRLGDKIRYSVTNEEGAVVAISNNTPCVAVRFGNSFAYLVATKELEFGKFLAAENEKWGKVIRAANIKL